MTSVLAPRSKPAKAYSDRVSGTGVTAPNMVAGHSLGEFSALVANETMSFEDGLKLVHKRASAMQKACEVQESTMAAVLGLEDQIVEEVCEQTPGVVVAANYNCPGQLVISGEIEAVKMACETLKNKGARRALILPVGGAFHSPLMAPARESLAQAIENTMFSQRFRRCWETMTFILQKAKYSEFTTFRKGFDRTMHFGQLEV